eukprot:CAMPEP_0206238230 /NCGR_PEP_ID=MMETSP0047_2-20121206/14709_1 /ASSEMBLY_ACC=CAM_ASM_000192 /TAXON_ID=195065 /ORGANISM="Chroomonas mesostigmatica_cf, Strain CCMP1168" /LENGTH=62 /DNA_ID=CAMNT_0053662761 /DNA_START=151 /DNA_END=335 /DNA_ORIENTATION=-
MLFILSAPCLAFSAAKGSKKPASSSEATLAACFEEMGADAAAARLVKRRLENILSWVLLNVR